MPEQPKTPQVTPELLAWLDHLYPIPRFQGPDPDYQALLYSSMVQRSVVDRIRLEYNRQQSKGE